MSEKQTPSETVKEAASSTMDELVGACKSLQVSQIVSWAILVCILIIGCLVWLDCLYFGALFLTWKVVDYAWGKALPAE